MKLSKKARRRLKKNKALHHQQQQQQQEATIQKTQFQQAYQTCVPFVTYSKVDNMIAPTEIVYGVRPTQPTSLVTYEKVSTSPPSSSGLSSMADSDSDSLRSPECLEEEDWSSNSGESSSGVYVDDSLSGSRSPSPQKTGFVYSAYHCEQPDPVVVE